MYNYVRLSFPYNQSIIAEESNKHIYTTIQNLAFY